MKLLKLLITVSLLFLVSIGYSATWTYLGNSGFTKSGANFGDFVVDPVGNPIVTFQDTSYLFWGTMMKNTNSWYVVKKDRVSNITYVDGFTSNSVNYLMVALGLDGVPYVVYSDMKRQGYGSMMKATLLTNSQPSVVKYSFTTNIANSFALDINVRTTTNYTIVFQDKSQQLKLTVMLKTNGSDPFVLGNAGFTSNYGEIPSVCQDTNVATYVAAKDYNQAGKVSLFVYTNGVTNNTVASNGAKWFKRYTTTTPANYPTIKFYNGALWLAYKNETTGKAVVMKSTNLGVTFYNWASTGISTARADYVSFDIALPTSNMYIAYSDFSTNSKLTVMKYNIQKTFSNTNSFNYKSTNFVAIYSNTNANVYTNITTGISGTITWTNINNNNTNTNVNTIKSTNVYTNVNTFTNIYATTAKASITTNMPKLYVDTFTKIFLGTNLVTWVSTNGIVTNVNIWSNMFTNVSLNVSTNVRTFTNIFTFTNIAPATNGSADMKTNQNINTNIIVFTDIYNNVITNLNLTVSSYTNPNTFFNTYIATNDWVTLGKGISLGRVSEIKIRVTALSNAITNGEVPSILYQDGAKSNKLSLIQYK